MFKKKKKKKKFRLFLLITSDDPLNWLLSDQSNKKLKDQGKFRWKALKVKHMSEESRDRCRNSQMGRMYVIWNLVPCIGKSSYSSTSLEYYLRVQVLFSLGDSWEGEDCIFIQISLDPSQRPSTKLHKDGIIHVFGEFGPF